MSYKIKYIYGSVLFLLPITAYAFIGTTDAWIVLIGSILIIVLFPALAIALSNRTNKIGYIFTIVFDVLFLLVLLREGSIKTAFIAFFVPYVIMIVFFVKEKRKETIRARG